MPIEVPDKWRARIVRSIETASRCRDGSLVKAEAVIAFTVLRKRPEGDTTAEDRIEALLRTRITQAATVVDLERHGDILRQEIHEIVPPTHPYLRVADILVLRHLALAPPRGLRVFADVDTVGFSVTWSRWKGIVTAILSAAVLAVLFEPFFGSAAAEAAETGAEVPPVAAWMWAAAAALVYLPLVFLVNRTSLSVGPEGLRLTHGPLPWFRLSRRHAGAVAGVEVDRVGGQGVAAGSRVAEPFVAAFPKYDLTLRMRDGAVCVFPQLLFTAAQVDFVKWYLADALGTSPAGDAPSQG